MLAITLLSFSNLSDIVVRKERKMTGMTDRRTDREKYRKTEIQRDRETERQSDRERQRDRETEWQRDTERYREIERQIDREIQRQIDREKERQNSLNGKVSSDSNQLMLSVYLCHKERLMHGLLSATVDNNRRVIFYSSPNLLVHHQILMMHHQILTF